MIRLDLKKIARLRICVGFLGESQQYSWWQSSFFSPSSKTFLTPIFAKTSFLSQHYGMKQAASIVHDDHIGIGKGVFHLFRLPEIYEIKLHKIIESPETAEDVKLMVCSKDKAEEFLQEYTTESDTAAIGPVQMGGFTDIMEKSVWKRIAYHYLKAFRDGNKTFPFFSEAG